MTFHIMHHTCASMLIAASLSIPDVVYVLGHVHPQVTIMIYAHLIERSTRRATALMEQSIARQREAHAV